ncbi:hypothetical protein R6242_16355 [Iodobacter sp. CM08]|uniref:hypothetical protein n=1 Tax=Iodobacter sp. CM08 TaxID=3085902 RepID=UPI002981E157|nr:hypothetical protein [Iodobacter sp. CM08]MDW5418139.1 hypothetical protein [Iodobacter sp. CM08]
MHTELETEKDAHILAAINAIYSVFEQDRPLHCGSSYGKDSATLIAVVFLAAIRAKQNGLNPIISITTGDTLIDNPIMAPYARRELKKSHAYAKSKNIEIYTAVSTPSFLLSFVGKVLSGKGLPTFPSGSGDCSSDYKISGQERARSAMIKEIKSKHPELKVGKNQPNEPVLALGVRRSESIARGANMARRGDSTDTPQRSDSGSLVLAPIGNWSTEEVWMFLLEHRDGERVSYSDFAETDKLYGDAGGGTSCGYKSDIKFENEQLTKPAPPAKCSARFGCFLCTAVASDSSVETMIEGNEKEYGFMRAGNKLRNFLMNTRWDWSRRHWIGRTISKDGENTILIQPDTYSPAMVLEIYRYLLTIQYDDPRMTTITFNQAFSLDLMWSLNAYHAPNTAINEYHEIMAGKKRYDVPNVPYVPRTKFQQGKLKVHELRWANEMAFGGLRSLEAEMATFDTGLATGCGGTRQTGGGAVIPDNIDNTPMFTVHNETYEMVSDFMPEDIAALNDSTRPTFTNGYLFWLRMGAINMSTNTSIDHDEILCRSNWREMKGLAGQQSPEKLIAMCEPDSVKLMGVDELEERRNIEARKTERKQSSLEKVIRIYPRQDAAANSKFDWQQISLFST